MEKGVWGGAAVPGVGTGLYKERGQMGSMVFGEMYSTIPLGFLFSLNECVFSSTVLQKKKFHVGVSSVRSLWWGSLLPHRRGAKGKGYR